MALVVLACIGASATVMLVIWLFGSWMPSRFLAVMGVMFALIHAGAAIWAFALLNRGRLVAAFGRSLLPFPASIAALVLGGLACHLMGSPC